MTTVTALTVEQLQPLLPDGWAVTSCGNRIQRTFQNPSYAKALAFVQAIGVHAESVDHHPDIHLTWPETTVTWWTHTANGVTHKDLDAAEHLNQLFSQL